MQRDSVAADPIVLTPGRRQWMSRATLESGQLADDEAHQRRVRESQRVEERVQYIYNQEDWHRELAKVRESRVKGHVLYAGTVHCAQLVHHICN